MKKLLLSAVALTTIASASQFFSGAGGGSSVTNVTATLPIISSGGTTPDISCRVATGSVSGCLSSADFTTFNGKQAAGNYITALTGDVSATGPGSVASTLATVNSNVGSFTNANITVNAKGLITAAANGTVNAGTVTSVALSVPATSIFGVTGSPVTNSGTLGLTTSGTSGGIPYFSSTSQLASSALLTANAIVLGGGAATAPVSLGSLGTTATVLHGNAAGAPTFGAVALGSDVSGTLPIANGGTNSTATATAGGVGYGTGTAHAYTAAGTTGQVLISAAAGTPVWGTDVLGVATNSSAAAGFKGEYIETLVTTNTNFSTTGTTFDTCSISLTAGDYDITGNLQARSNGATTAQIEIFIGTVAGNNSTGQSVANTATGVVPTAATDSTDTVANYRQTISTTTTYYLKVFSSYTVATPQYKCRLLARRMR